MRKGRRYIIFSLLVAATLTTNQLAFLFLHDHQPALTECHSTDPSHQAGDQLHSSECLKTCDLCGLFFSKIQALSDHELFLFHPALRSHQIGRLLASHAPGFLLQDPRGPPAHSSRTFC